MTKQKYSIPVRLNERLELLVETLASSGDGICRYQGYTIFVPTAIPGDRLTGEIIKTTPRFGIARILKTLKSSPDRVSPPCHVFPICGGCKLQDLPYKKQLQFKKDVVRDSLERLGKLELNFPIRLLPADTPYFYRNKGSFAIQKIAGKNSIGFYQQRSHDVVDSDRCDTVFPEINTTKEIVRRHLGSVDNNNTIL